MNPMKTKILLSVAIVLVIGLAAGAFWWLRRPQVITFSDDSKVTLLAVEYGKRHAPPNVKAPAASTTARTAAARRVNGSFTTTNDTLVLWVRQEFDATQNQFHNFQYFVYDQAGTACVGNSMTRAGNGPQGNSITAIQLDAFPQRQGKFIVRALENGNGGQEMSDQKFVIANPVHGAFANWTAEPLPATKEDDDLSVTLTKLAAGADSPSQRDQDNPDDPANKGVQATFTVSQNGKPVTNWRPVSIETSDATGNHVNGGITQNNWQDNNDTVAYQYGLWPDEPAWKLRVGFSEQSDFSDSEVWSVQNIPLEPGRRQDFMNGVRNNTNSVFAEADLNGVHVKIFPGKLFTDAAANSRQAGGFQVQMAPPPPAGMQMTIVKLTDDQGEDVQRNGTSVSRSATSSTYGYLFNDLGNAKSLNFTIALHKSHFFEFTVKPETEKP
jgi:hypothetical protein